MSSIAVSEFVIKVVSEIVVYHYDDSELTGFFHDAGVPQLPKSLNKVAVCRDYLRLANQGAGIDPLMILGRLLKRYMDDDRSFTTQHAVEGRDINRERIACALEMEGLRYSSGGVVSAGHSKREFFVGGLYFMIWWLDEERLLLAPDSLVFIDMNLGFGDEKDEVETWYFQDAKSYSSKGAYKKDFETSDDEVRLYQLRREDLYQVVDCKGLAAIASKCAKRRLAVGKSA